MRKTKIAGVIALICYIAVTALSIAAAVFCCAQIVILKNGEYVNWEGLAAGIALAIFIIFAIISAAAAVISAIPLIMKAVSLKKGRRGLTVACVVFDVLMLLASAVMLIVSFGDETYSIALVIAVLPLLYGAALISNLISLKGHS